LGFFPLKPNIFFLYPFLGFLVGGGVRRQRWKGSDGSRPAAAAETSSSTTPAGPWRGVLFFFPDLEPKHGSKRRTAADLLGFGLLVSIEGASLGAAQVRGGILHGGGACSTRTGRGRGRPPPLHLVLYLNPAGLLLFVLELKTRCSSAVTLVLPLHVFLEHVPWGGAREAAGREMEAERVPPANHGGVRTGGARSPPTRPWVHGDREWWHLAGGDHMLRRTTMEEVEVALPTVQLSMNPAYHGPPHPTNFPTLVPQLRMGVIHELLGCRRPWGLHPCLQVDLLLP
jgi:hypothetical protein